MDTQEKTAEQFAEEIKKEGDLIDALQADFDANVEPVILEVEKLGGEETVDSENDQTIELEQVAMERGLDSKLNDALLDFAPNSNEA